MRSFSALCIFVLLLIAPIKARAISAGESVLVVGISTVSGAVLGASTLPFYEDSAAHTKNIFYGAAIGAVVGVLLSAYSGVEESKSNDDEEARVRRDFPLQNAQNSVTQTRLLSHTVSHAPKSIAIGSSEILQATVAAQSVWSPLVTWRF